MDMEEISRGKEEVVLNEAADLREANVPLHPTPTTNNPRELITMDLANILAWHAEMIVHAETRRLTVTRSAPLLSAEAYRIAVDEATKQFEADQAAASARAAEMIQRLTSITNGHHHEGDELSNSEPNGCEADLIPNASEHQAGFVMIVTAGWQSDAAYALEYDGIPDDHGTREPADIVGWQAICVHPDHGVMPIGPMWHRVKTTADHDLATRRLYVDDDDVDDIRAVWPTVEETTLTERQTHIGDH